MSTNEQEKFNAWWESKGTNSAILRAQALSAWLARAEAEQPQPAEEPNEWVVQDRVPPRRNVDEFRYVRKDGLACPWKSVYCGMQWPHGEWICGERLEVRCRRRDLPKVEQAEQWPKYYTGIVSGTAYVKRLSPRECVVVETDGTETAPMRWADWDERKRREITEAEAMALLKPKQCAVGCHGPRCTNPALPGKDHCSECGEEPQPQKTRVRLWSCDTDGVIVAKDNCPAPGWTEIHHDSEG